MAGSSYGPGSTIRGGRSGRGGKAPITAASVYAKRGITPTGEDAAAMAEDKAYKDTQAALAAQIAAQSAAGQSGGTSGPNAMDRYTRQLQKMLKSGSYMNPYNDLMAKLSTMYGSAQGQINTAMDNLSSTLQGQANPYSGFQAQQTAVTPQLTELLKSQGVSASPLEQMAAATKAQNTGQADAFTNLVGTLGSIYGANQKSAQAAGEQQRANLLDELAMSQLGIGSQIAQQGRTQQSNLVELLLKAIAKGGRPSGGRLF